MCKKFFQLKGWYVMSLTQNMQGLKLFVFVFVKQNQQHQNSQHHRLKIELPIMIKPASVSKFRQQSIKKPQSSQQILKESPKKQSSQQNFTSQQNKKVTDVLNGPSEKAFMRYYEQNIKLKKQLEDRNAQIQELKKRLTQLMNLNKTASNPYAELKQLQEEVKKPGVPRGQSVKNKTFYNTTKGNGETKKVENLLQIIDTYKQKLLIAEQESANLRRQKALLQQDLQLNTKLQKPSQMDESLIQKSISREEELFRKLKEKTSQFQLEHQRNKFVEAELRRLQNKIKTMEWDADRLEELKVENRVLEERIMKLAYVTDREDGFDRRAVEDKNRELQTKMKAGMEKYTRLKEQKMKLQVDMKLMQNKLIEIQHQLQQTQKENLTLKKNEINDPVIQKLIRNKELMSQVVAEIEKPKPKFQNSTLSPYQSVQKLILEKESLAKELIELKNKLKNMEQAWKQKETMVKIQKEQMLQQLNMLPVTDKNIRYTSKQGVQYDGDISSFSDTSVSGNTKGVNFFDLFLGQVNLIQALVKTVTRISSINNPLIIATVDLYNFETKHTKTIQGLSTSFNTEFTFRIAEDEFFYRFMSKESFKISIWASEGNTEHFLGSVEVPLKQLILKNKPNIAPVINTSSPIIHSQKVVGTINFDMRMRFPIYQQTAHIIHQPLVTNPQEQSAPRRKLIIQIEEGYDFSPSSNLFVYYPFRLQDHKTKTARGPQPKWGHYKMIDVVYNEDFKNYLRKNEVEFIVFDDNVVLYDDKDNDVVGTASLSLVALLQTTSSTNPIRQKVEIKKNGVRTGFIDVKVFWYESKQKLEPKDMKKKQQAMETLHSDVVKHIRDIGSTPEQQFRSIDKNGSGMISFEQFIMWMARVKKSFDFSQDFISKYFDTFGQPLNLMSWVNRLQQRSEEEKRQTDLMPELGMINQMLRKNSVQISSQVTLREYLKDKQLFNEALNIDQDRNGMISKEQLLKYMKEHNIQFDESKIKQDKVKLLEFLREYST